MFENPLNFLTEEQKIIVNEEMREEGYCVLQKWKNRKKQDDYRVLRDTVIITPDKIIDRIIWAFKRVIK